MRRGLVALLVVVLLGALGFVGLLLTKDQTQAFSLNVPPSGPQIKLKAGSVVCQRGIDVPIGGEFVSARVPIGTVMRPGPAFTATLRQGGRVVSRGTIPAGFLDNSSPPIVLPGGPHEGRGFELCLENEGRRAVYLYGSGGDANPGSTLTVDGRERPKDLDLAFDREPRSLAAAAGDVLSRATLFHSPRVSATVFGAVVVVLLLVAVAGVGIALKSGLRDDER